MKLNRYSHIANQMCIRDRDTTFEDLQLDSLDTVDLVMSLEEIFDITIEMQEGLKSVGDVVNLIDSLLEKK